MVFIRRACPSRVTQDRQLNLHIKGNRGIDQFSQQESEFYT